MRFCKPLQYWRQFCGNKSADCYSRPQYKFVDSRPPKPKAIAGTGGFNIKTKKKGSHK